MKLKKFFTLILCMLLFSSAFSISSFAEDGPVITIDCTKTAVPGDTVIVKINASENPGIMAMTFTVSYDKEALTFEKYIVGKWNDYTIVDHPDKGYVSFVNCEIRNRKYNGTIFTLRFTVNDTAKPGEHNFKIMNIHPEKYGDALNGCFATKEHTPITATIINGSVNVGKTCSNSGHTFEDFKTTLEPTCIATGLKSRSCSVCGHTESKELEKIEHVYEKDWTVDVVATAEQTGIMSRHCKNCPAVTDKIYYSLEESEENEFENTEESTITSDDWEKLEEIEKENEKIEAENKKEEQKKAALSFWAKIGNFFANVFKAIGNFFKNLFS